MATSTPANLRPNEFVPGKLPGNSYAFKNNIYLSPQDYNEMLQMAGGRKPLFGRIKGLVLRIEPLADMRRTEIGASAMQKEAMRVSKIDTITIDPIKVKDDNPLATIECMIDVVFIDEKLPREPGRPLALD